jgi:hypothetical protein
MAIPWLIALKVIPWADVIEHAPKVLKAARKLMERPATETAVPPSGTAVDASDAAPPSLGELKNRLIAAQVQLNQQAQVQAEMSQTLAELAEQNARLVGAVDALRLRTRVLLVVVAALLLAQLVEWIAR